MGALDGKRAIVTGASSGIGAATARALAREGAQVAVGARRVERLAELGEGFVALELDVTDAESSASFVTSAVHRLEGLDILVNNAGLALGRDPFDESTEEDEEVLIETNVHGLVRMTRLCLPHLGDGAHIVNVGSIAGRQAYEKAALYVTTKFAVRGFTYALREDLLGRPIRITLVDPGLVETDFSLVRYRGRRHCRVRGVCGHPAGARQRGRARGQGTSAELALEDLARLVAHGDHDSRGLHVLHLR